MATAIIMPKAGMAMEEGTVIKWLKAEGDKVEQGEPLLEILTDKVNMEVEAQASGTLIKILKEEGEVVPVTQIIGYIGTPGELVEEAGAPAAEGKKPEEEKKLKQEAAGAEVDSTGAPAGSMLMGSSGKAAATPAARRMASEKNIELGKVRATGQYGEIKVRDVLAHKGIVISPLARRVAEANEVDLSTVSGSGYNGKIVMQDVASKLSAGAEIPAAPAVEAWKETQFTPDGKNLTETQFTPDGKEILEVIPYSGIRKIIGERLAHSKFTAPHLYFTQR
jgi:pyruvate dehydrogenase E2 component (dihydrolipoamide acetyltransferase)